MKVQKEITLKNLNLWRGEFADNFKSRPRLYKALTENQVYFEGDDEKLTVTFHVDAIGAVAYQWQCTSNNGVSWTDLSWEGATTATMTRTLNLNTVTYKYRCMLKAADGSIVYTDTVGFTSP